MLRTVFGKTLWEQRRSLVGWGIGLFLLVLMEAALWPSIRTMPNIQQFLDSYPETVKKLFELNDFGTGRGFLNAELYTAVLPILFIVFGVGRGARAVAGEEEAGTLEVLLLTPVSAARLVLQQAAALVAATGALGLVLLAAVLGLSPVFDLGITVAQAASGSLAMVLLGVEFGCVALAVGAVTGRRAIAVTAAATAALAAYLLHVLGQLVEAVRPWQPLSPFHQALDGGPLGAGLPAAYLWMVLATAVVLAAAIPVFERRDVSIH